MFVTYVKYGIDGIFKKIIKFLLVLINMITFIIIKGIDFGIIFIVYLLQDIVDYVAGFFLIFAVLSLFIFSGESSPNAIPFIPANIEAFCMFSIIAFVIEGIKNFIVNKSENTYALLCGIEDKVFMRLLLK